MPKQVKVQDVKEFKISIKTIIKPKRHKHFSCGSKQGNKILTQIRVGRSDLKLHQFTIGLSENTECQCHFKSESPEHYFFAVFPLLTRASDSFQSG